MEVLDSLSTTCFVRWFLEALRSIEKVERGRFLAILWAIWSIRNARIFEEERPNPDVITLGLVRMVSDYQSCLDVSEMCESRRHGDALGDSGWKRPVSGVIKINSDAAVLNDDEIGLGVVGRDSEGMVVFIASRRCYARWTVEVAEAKAMLFGLEVARRLNVTCISLESDALNVVQAVRNSSFDRNSFGLCIRDICSFSLLFDLRETLHVKRGGNTVAHLVARLCANANEELCTETDFPSSVLTMAELDLI
ncbi:uncharacterized protein LOC141597469 [Silene latifolia]|uniref:uncharacterized protein LOC141597469 n=1 Tax=Silene latifolia TaxID=37657 RepID=UPI003D787D98